MHRLSTSFVLAYHGCDSLVAEALLGGTSFRKSENDYDWLGPGIYFWEANPQRGLDFAIEASGRRNSAIRTPAVVGAVIDLGLCLDMTTLAAIERVTIAYESLRQSADMVGAALPANSDDLLLRRLDCAVIQRLHALLDLEKIRLDSVRGVFIEDDPVYETSGFHKKTHVQIAVCNPACIKGVFRVADEALRHWTPIE